MKKLVLAIVMMVGLSKLSWSQEYKHGLGAQVNFGLFNQQYNVPGVGDFSDIYGVPVGGFLYRASLAFDMGGATFCATTYPFLGFSYSSSTLGGASIAIGAELPILAEIYLGDADELCGFVGAGWTFAFLGSSGFGAGSIVGPEFDLGVQFPFFGQVIQLKGAFALGVNKGNIDPTYTYTKNSKMMFSFGGVYRFGV